MNFYNPYSFVPRSRGIMQIFKNLNFGSILTNTSKTLNVINQAIPVVKEVSPLLKNAKTMFRVMSEFNKPDIVNEEVINNIDKEVEEPKSNLTFFQ